MYYYLQIKRFLPAVLFLFMPFISFSQGGLIMNGAKINVVDSAYIVTGDVSLTSASTLNINSSTVKIAGSITNNSGIFDVTNGVVEMNGKTTQAIPVSSFYVNKIKRLIISNDVTLEGQDSITEQLSFGDANSKTFATNDFLTLKSSSLGTARVADITNAGLNSGNSVTGIVKIERYISAHRAWRLLTSPVTVASSQTIRDAWQEGVNNTDLVYANNLDPVPGYGTHITLGNAPGLGFDVGINKHPSIQGYNTVTGAWDPIPNTNTTRMTAYPAYMVFVRGDRSVNLAQGVNSIATNTVLRSSGVLNKNDQNFSVAATGFTVVNNPFASALDLNGLAKDSLKNIQDNFYLWDPKITGTNGVGGYVNFNWNGSGYSITPFTGDGISQYISSGGAFFARSRNQATSGTLVVKETDKTVLNSDDVNRPLNGTDAGNLVTNLYSINADGTTSIVDGVLNNYKTIFSNAIDYNDAVKLPNIAENLSTVRNGQALTVERRQSIGLSDTIFFNMLNMKVKSYVFEFIANISAAYDLTGFLQDNYLHTSTPIDLNGTTRLNFNIADIPASWNPARFLIVFRKTAVLPVTFNSIRALKQNDAIRVQWKVENQTGIKQYNVEKSLDGVVFTRSAMVTAIPNSNGKYQWLDQNINQGYNYYRVKTLTANADTYYSSIVKVFISGERHQIIVPANQWGNGVITFSFINMQEGSYKASLFTSLGQLIATKKIQLEQGSENESIDLKRNIPHGEYMLEIIKPGNEKLSYKIFLY